jgi:transcriptional regulator with XRE-family HTH domain
MPHRLLALIGCELLPWARQQAAMPVSEAASRIGVSEARLESWENGRTRPTLDELRRVARVYDMRIGLFFLREPPLTSPRERSSAAYPNAGSQSTA